MSLAMVFTAPGEQAVASGTPASTAAEDNKGGEQGEAKGAVKAEKEAAPAAKAGEKQLSIGNYLAGRFAETQGDTRNGLKYVEEAVKKDPENKKNLSSLFRMYVLSGDLDKAPPLAEKLLGTKVVDDGVEFSPEMFLLLHSAKQKDFAKAEKYLKLLPKDGFNNLIYPLLAAWIKQGKGEVKAPLETKSLIADQKMVLPHVYMTFAYVNELAGFNDKAAEYFEKAVADSRAQTLRAVQASAGFYARHGMKEKYTKLVDGYFASHGESYLTRQLLKFEDGKPPSMLVNNAGDGMAEAFYTVSSLFHGVRAAPDEIASLNFALHVRPDFPEAQFLLATTYELAEDFPSAIRIYAGIDKQSPYFLRGRVRSLYDESEAGDAQVEVSLTKLAELAKEMPGDIDALLARGDIQRAHGRFKEAIENYTGALERIKTPDKTHWAIFFSRGACYERLGRWEDAEGDMRKALALSPKEPDVLNYLGYTWLNKQRNIAEAKKMIEDAYEARPEDAHIIDSMGYSLYISGDYASAQEYFQQALERTPDDPTVNEHLGDTYWQLGRKVEARYQWNRALANESDPTQKHMLEEKLQNGIAIKPSASLTEEKKTVIDLTTDE